jgi:hypothetical protein
MVTNGMQNTLRNNNTYFKYQKPMHFYIGFFLPISMNLNMKKKLILGLPALCMIFLVSCEKNTRVRGTMKMIFLQTNARKGKPIL